jgi:hypothetical protein
VCTSEANNELAEDGPSHWNSRSGEEAELRANIEKYYRGDRRNHQNGFSVTYPDCWDEDQEALDELMATLRERRRG